MLFVDHLGWSHHEQRVINCRTGMGVGHQEPSQTKGCQNLINIQTTAYDRSNFIYMKGSKLKMYKSLALRMFWVHSNSVEPKVQHVLCHCYAAINIFIKIFNVLIIFSYSMDPSCLVSTVQAAGGGVVVGCNTLGPLVPSEHRLNTTAYLSIVADHVIPLWLQCTHLLMANSSRIMHHVTKLKSSQTGFLNMTMSSLYSNGLHSHQISIQ